VVTETHGATTLELLSFAQATRTGACNARFTVNGADITGHKKDGRSLLDEEKERPPENLVLFSTGRQPL
jgi:hypothetical protein